MGKKQITDNTTNGVLHKRISRLECQCWKNSKYSRHEYIEIVEIPDTINN